MGVSKAQAEWNGTLKSGSGTMTPAHAAVMPFSLGSRFEGQPQSNPEELLGAAFAGCYSMALSGALEKAGASPTSIRTSAEVGLEKDGDGFTIRRITLRCEAVVDGLEDDAFQALAKETKAQCPVGKALAAVAQITLEAKLAR